MATVIVLDARMLIAVLDADDPHHAAALATLESQPDDLAVNTLNLAEVAVGPARAGRLRTVHDVVDALNVVVVPVGSGDWEPLARLRADTGLRLPDCCVLHTALQNEAAVVTFDRRLTRAAQEAGLRAVGA
jgi:predicted nucleic acid-binding protein